ncbi:hypothetical protein QQS21_012337 [Conoideocrella luteorostrata]|uniref:BHLH domain-containing protein n=1 Tax=Conoideocrella luteorostrata TaxID=1105319 RepID=A0AAJ0CDQ6_9HYPO|nr:hypothetical protein QQS21_012337 [Conoideocrella luteorostrata]
MLATQVMTADPTRQEFFSNFDHYHSRPGYESRLWSDFPQHHFDGHSSPTTPPSQFELSNQMSFLANMNAQFSSNQAAFMQQQNYRQDGQWPSKDMFAAQALSETSLTNSPMESQPPQVYQRSNDEAMSGMAKIEQSSPNHRNPNSSPILQEQNQPPMQVRPFPVGHLRHQSSLDFGEDLLRNSHDTVNENIFADWCWGQRERAVSKAAHEASVGSVRWGSDGSFASPICSPTAVGHEPVNGRPFGHVKFPEHPESDMRDENSIPRAYSEGFYKMKSGMPTSFAEHPITWPILRTRTNPMDRDVLSTYRALSLEYLGSALHEQKSLATVGPRREKLTEEQKRRNHILHEQKRRAMIKDGFDDLLKLVPDLKDRGLSKSAILLKAAEWLGTLASGNKALRAQARALDGHDDTTSKSKYIYRQPRGRRSNRRI